ncbi:MAG: polysaccharide deacetylase family protein [Clostridia bacterium]|nr:polysaccharide deacetylase family protein [Clostridia bacterium]
MAGYRPDTGLARSDSARRGRILWVTVAAVFLTLMAVVLWVWVRTRAEDGYGAGRLEHHLDEPAAEEATSAEGYPAALIPAYPSPFRPLPESQPETAEPAEEAPTETETASPRKNDEIVYHSRKNDRMEIALSFDDGPHPRLTPLILDILREYDVKATFFMVGENVKYYPNAARAVVEAGHELGNHTFSHRRFSRMSEHEMLDEIASCEEAISSVSETPVHFIRPPEGQMNDVMRRVIGTLDYRIILWDVDTRDWAHTPPDEIARHILDTVQAGDIILMHDFIGYDSPTPEALRLVIPELLSRGYRFVTVGELVDGD